MVVSFGQTMNICERSPGTEENTYVISAGYQKLRIIRGATVPLGLPKGTDAQRSNMNHKCRAVSLAFSISIFLVL